MARENERTNCKRAACVQRLVPYALLVGLLCGAFVQNLQAHQDHQSHRGTPVPREILERPVTLRSGIGSLHRAVTTSSPEAQKFYDQGLAYLHSYVWIEAARSFHQALRLDPNMVMAYLGLTDTYIGLQDVATARLAFLEAKRREKNNTTERERAWIEVCDRELDLLEDSSDPDKYVSYRHAINEALKHNPDDPWLWIQRGLADESSPFTHGQAGGVDTLAFYRTALALAPENSAAHHYYAHTLENLGRASEALKEANIYLASAPAIAHAHHMHGHELMRLGRTEEAIAEFLKTKQLETEYSRVENIPSRYDWHYTHNLYLLAMSYQSLGQMKSAEAAFHKAFAVPGYTEFLEYNRKAWPEFLLERGRFPEALEASLELTKSTSAMARLAGHTLAGQALLGMGRLNDAKDELASAEQASEQVPVRAIAALPFPISLRAEILIRENRIEGGEALLQGMLKMILAQPGPDAWSAARFQLEGVARPSRRAGDWPLAELTAQQLIEYAPTYAGGHFALALVDEHAGDMAGAREHFAAAEKLWGKADRDLRELQRVHEAVATLR